MMDAPVLSFVVAALALAGSPGPNTLSVAATGAAFGRAAGFRYMLGIDVGMAIVIAMVGSGVTGFLLALPMAAPIITVMAALYFVYLAWRIATSPPLGDSAASGTEPRWFEGVLLSLVNPKGYAAMAAMFSTFTLIQHSTLYDGLLKAALLLSVIVFVNVCWLFTGIALTRLMQDQRISRVLNIVFAIALILSVLLTLRL
jgi:threonine/homoserine/homoserine lactone efflux protein